MPVVMKLRVNAVALHVSICKVMGMLANAQLRLVLSFWMQAALVMDANAC